MIMSERCELRMQRTAWASINVRDLRTIKPEKSRKTILVARDQSPEKTIEVRELGLQLPPI